MQSPKRLRKSFSEEKTLEKAQLSLSSATPSSKTNMDARTDDASIHDMLHNILQQVSGLNDMYKKVDEISQKLCDIERNMEAMDTRLVDVERGVGFMETEFEEIKEQVKEMQTKKAEVEYVNELQKNVIDLVNRSKRNNVVIHGVPEGEEGDTHDCADFARTFFSTHLKVTDAEIERAHRTPMGKRNQNADRPRPIHVKLLRFVDRERLLRNSSALKDVRIRGRRLGISDDVHKETRAEHSRLMVRVRKMREEGKFAYIPNSVPRVIKYKDGPKNAPGALKTLRVSDL